MTGLVMKYFVLKPAGDDVHARASRKAMRAYAGVIVNENPDLARELRDWAEQETIKFLERGHSYEHDV